jgi:hypothetical protein
MPSTSLAMNDELRLMFKAISYGTMYTNTQSQKYLHYTSVSLLHATFYRIEPFIRTCTLRILLKKLDILISTSMVTV